MDAITIKQKIDKFKQIVIKLKKQLKLNTIYDFPFSEKKLKELSIFHNTILETIPQIFTIEELNFLNNKENKSFVQKLVHEVVCTPETEKEFGKYNELFDYITYILPPNGVYGVYYKLTEKGLAFDNNFEISIDFNQDFESLGKTFKNIKRVGNFPDIPLLITEDGKCYNARTFHDDLTRWFVYSGKDISNIARVRLKYKNFGELYIEGDDTIKSALNFNSEADKRFGFHVPLIALTDEQVKTIMQIYKISMTNNSHFKGIEEILTSPNLVSGLGFDPYSHNCFIVKDEQKINITTHNLGLFEKYGKGGYFKLSTFNKFLYENINDENNII